MKILVVDDSALMRQTITKILSTIANAEIKAARDGEDALEKLVSWQPDVVTLDINMPNMDGITCLSHIMIKRPTPVVIVSSLAQEGAIATLEALHLGAVDFVAKPGGTICTNLVEMEDVIRQKVVAARKMRVNALTDELVQEPKPTTKPIAETPAKQERESEHYHSRGLSIIGVSTGGPGAVEALLQHLPQGYPMPIIVAQHMPESFTAAFATRLNRSLDLSVEEISYATVLKPGHVYVCKGDRDCVVTMRDNALVAMPAPMESKYTWHPSISKLVSSALRVCGAQNLVCTMMTGMGNDGAQEMAAVAAGGGSVYAQTPDSCVVPSMVSALINLNGSVHTAKPDNLGQLMLQGARLVLAKGVHDGVS